MYKRLAGIAAAAALIALAAPAPSTAAERNAPGIQAVGDQEFSSQRRWRHSRVHVRRAWAPQIPPCALGGATLRRRTARLPVSLPSPGVHRLPAAVCPQGRGGLPASDLPSDRGLPASDLPPDRRRPPGSDFPPGFRRRSSAAVLPQGLLRLPAAVLPPRIRIRRSILPPAFRPAVRQGRLRTTLVGERSGDGQARVTRACPSRIQCHSRTSTKCPVIAAAAAIAGDTRWVRPL